MKLFTIILVVLVMALATIPCCLFDNCPGDKKEIVDLNHKEHSSSDNDDCGSCSPFFTCAGCAIAIDLFSPLNYIFEKTFLFSAEKDRFIPGETRFSSSFYYSFWQPPKL